MPQQSIGFAIGATRVREGKLITRDQLERLLAAPTAEQALRVLVEWGWSTGEDTTHPYAYEQWLDEQLAQTRAYVRKITPDVRATDAFLLGVDAHNAKVLYKARLLGISAEDLLREGGAIEIKRLRRAIEEKHYEGLPPCFEDAFRQLAQTDAPSPAQIETELDRARIKQALSWCKESALQAGIEYFTGWADRANVLALLRLRSMGRNASALSAVFLPGGKFSLKTLIGDFEEPERLKLSSPYGRFFRDGLAQSIADGNAAALELAWDNHLIEIFKAKRYRTDTIEPLVGYFLGRERECAMVRLAMVAKINGLSPKATSERLRELYV